MSKTVIKVIIDTVFRGVCGLLFFYALDIVLKSKSLPCVAGLNPITFLAASLLGIPGIVLVIFCGIIARLA